MLAVELLVAFEDRLGQIAKGRAGRLLAAAFPRGARAGLLFRARALEAFEIERHAGIARGIDHEVERQAEGLVKMKGLGSGESRSSNSSIERG